MVINEKIRDGIITGIIYAVFMMFLIGILIFIVNLEDESEKLVYECKNEFCIEQGYDGYSDYKPVCFKNNENGFVEYSEQISSSICQNLTIKKNKGCEK